MAIPLKTAARLEATDLEAKRRDKSRQAEAVKNAGMVVNHHACSSVFSTNAKIKRSVLGGINKKIQIGNDDLFTARRDLLVRVFQTLISLLTFADNRSREIKCLYVTSQNMTSKTENRNIIILLSDSFEAWP